MWKKPDGKIEIQMSSCGCPPDADKSGIHGNISSSWWRINEEEWQKIEKGNVHDVYQLAKNSNSCKQFKEKVTCI